MSKVRDTGIKTAGRAMTEDALRAKLVQAEARMARLEELGCRAEAALHWLGKCEDWAYPSGCLDLWEGVYRYLDDIAALADMEAMFGAAGEESDMIQGEGS